MKINLGCGNDYKQGWLNIDQWPETNPDLVMNLEDIPWKLEDNCADEILLKYVLEQVGQQSSTFLAIFQELYRICKPDALINIRVPHPRHKDFLSNPTHLHPITPELFSSFDLATVELWQEHNLPGTPFAKYLKVDFELSNAQHQLSPYWQKEQAEGRIDTAGIMHAIDTYNNVVEWTDITLRVRKPFRPGHALRKTDAICIERHGGMGDVLMALAAAKALKALSDRPVAMVTSAAFHRLAEACPHIDYVTDDLSTIQSRYTNVRHVNLNPVAYGISRLHQVDAYLHAFGVSAAAEHKDIDLTLDTATKDEVEQLLASWPVRAAGRARILLHIGQGDPNRIWPLGHWTELALMLMSLGHQVIVIGTNNATAEREAEPVVDGLLSAVNRLSVFGTVALMRRSDLLISADSGPVQLAAASDIGIVGLYSVVKGACRLPFRHGVAQWRAEEVKPSCSFYPCYQQIHDAEVMAPFTVRLQNQTLSAAELLSNWCPDDGSFACMTQQITVPMVVDAIRRLDPALLMGPDIAASSSPSPQIAVDGLSQAEAPAEPVVKPKVRRSRKVAA